MKTARMHVALSIAVIATLALQGVGGASPSPPSSPEFPELIASSLESLGATEGMVEAARALEEGDREYPYVVPVGDLDGDGLADTVTVTSMPDAAEVTSELVLTARRGLDGSVLWTHPTGASGLSAVVPAPVGENGDQGLLLVSYQAVLFAGVGGTSTAEGFNGWFMGGADLAVDVVAVSGTGQELWRYESPIGHFLYPPTEVATEPLVAQDVPIVGGTLDATASPATDVLLALYDRTPTPEGQDDRVRTIVIDGADGSEVSTGVTDITGARTAVAPGPDLDGDGLDDYTILMDAVTEDADGGILALGGTDGERLWASERDVDWRGHWLIDAEDVTGDGVGDLVLRSFSGPPAPFSDAVGSQRVTLLDGATGTQVWDEPGDTARALGDVTGDGRAEVLVVTTVRTSTQAGVRYEARSAEGSAWSVQHLLPRQGATRATLSFIDAGDVDRDVAEGEDEGIPDFAQHLRLLDSSGDLVREDARVVGGRTGETLRATPFGGTALRQSVDGEGDDAVAVEAWGTSVRDVTVLDGLSGDELWGARLRARGETRVTGFGVRAADLDGDGRAELLVNAASITTTLTVPQGVERNERFVDAWVLSGRDGSILWHSDPLVVPEPAEVDGRVGPGEPFAWEGTGGSGTATTWSLREACASDDALYRCDRLLLELSNPPDPGEGTRTATAAVEIGDFDPVPAPVTDFDLYVYESDEYGTEGPEIDSAASLDAVERVEFPLTTSDAEPSRYVLVEVLYYTSVESGYAGMASVGPA